MAAITEATGAGPTAWQHVVAGHTQAEKWRIGLRDGSTAFVKAGSEEGARAQIEREAFILDAVAAAYMPKLYGAATADGWAVLVL
jgi:hypothetical protein